VLSGLPRCGVCGGTVIVVQGPYVGCSNHSNKRTCDNARLMRMEEIEGRVLEALRTHLLSPERVELAVETYRKEREERSKKHARDRRGIERELADLKVAMERVLNMVCKGVGQQSELGRRMNDIAARRRELEAMLPLAEKANVAVIHPQAGKRYRQQVEMIQGALSRGDSAGHEAVALVRGMIDRIVITPQPDRMDLQVFDDLAILFGNKPSPEEELGNAKAGCGGSIWPRPTRGLGRDLMADDEQSHDLDAKSAASLDALSARGRQLRDHRRGGSNGRRSDRSVPRKP
jgi:hypothetical protein